MPTYKIDFEGNYLITAKNLDEARRIADDGQADPDLIQEAQIEVTNVVLVTQGE